MQNLDKYNFHSHTYRCGHAFGEDEEYLVNAIKEGFKYYGISDHVMFPFLDQPGIRGNYENDFESYLESVKSLKNKYKNDIDLHLGMEVEYSPFLYDYYRDLLKNELEYLIMGQHFHMGQDMYFQSYDCFENAAEKYVEDILKGMESGLILYESATFNSIPSVSVLVVVLITPSKTFIYVFKFDVLVLEPLLIFSSFVLPLPSNAKSKLFSKSDAPTTKPKTLLPTKTFEISVADL